MQQSFDPATRIMTLSFLVDSEGPLSASGKSMKVAGTNAGKGGTEHVNLPDGRYMLNVSVFKTIKKAKKAEEDKKAEKVEAA